MALADEILERTDWSKRSKEFGELDLSVENRQTYVRMHFAPPSSGAVVPDQVRRLWRGLAPHRYVLVPYEVDKGSLWLRYAAIDWTRRPINARDAEEVRRLGAIGYKLASLYELIREQVSDEVLGWLACPVMKQDLEGEPRLGFVGAHPDPRLVARLPPEAIEAWPRCTERGAIFVIGMLLRDQLANPAEAANTPIGALIERCTSPSPGLRPSTLTLLRNAFLTDSGMTVAPKVPSPDRDAWRLVERGIGQLHAGNPQGAARDFASALKFNPRSMLARAGATIADARIASSLERSNEITEAPQQIMAAGRELERQRRVREALDQYRRLRFAEIEPNELRLAKARCLLALGDTGPALDFVARVLEGDAGRIEAHQVRTDSFLLRRDHPAALAAADAWLAAAPDDARAHYARGKALLALGRLGEARDAFERACVIDGHLIAALLLRREVDRMLGNVRAQVGTSQPMLSEIPPHLAELRDALVTGKLADGIALLRGDAYAHDPVARLLLAQLLATDHQHAAALEAFELAAALPDARAHDAYLGAARAQIALGRAAEALPLLDHILRDAPDLLEAFDVRATALRALGRTADADAAHAEYLARASRAR